jgi:hypothetical protein
VIYRLKGNIFSQHDSFSLSPLPVLENVKSIGHKIYGLNSSRGIFVSTVHGETWPLSCVRFWEPFLFFNTWIDSLDWEGSGAASCKADSTT